MTSRHLTPDFAVAPQIEPEDFDALAQAGFTTVIDNRPDAEVEPTYRSDMMAERAAQAGLSYHYLPIIPGQLGPDQVARFREILDSSTGPVLAYCRSGTRSCNLWALAAAKAGRDPGLLTTQAAGAGYDLSGIRPMLDALAGPKAE